MKIYFIVILLFLNIPFVSAQEEIIELGLLPSEYGEGMPVQEFEEFEKNVFGYFDSIKRFKIVKRPEDYSGIDWGWNNQSRSAAANTEAQKSNAGYLVQIIFGDTEWTAQAQSGAIIRTPNQGRTPITNPSAAWAQEASLWVTLNLYNVSTGVIENSTTVTADSYDSPEFRKSPAAAKRDQRRAINAAQKILWRKTRIRIINLIPLDILVEKITDQEGQEAATVVINAGGFHGLKAKDQCYVYYEKEYMVRGESVMRHVMAGKIIVKELNDREAVCQVRSGKKEIAGLLEKGIVLKCDLFDKGEKTDDYGF